MKNKLFVLICLSLFCMALPDIRVTRSRQSILVERGRNYEVWDNLNGTHTWESAPYWVLNASSGKYVPYIYVEADRFFQIQTGLIAARIYKSGYAEFYDPDMAEVRVYEESWEVQYWRSQGGGKWVSCGIYDPSFTVSSDELCVNVTASFATDYPNGGERAFSVTYIFRAGRLLKHEVAFSSYADSEFTFRVVQKWKGIAGSKVRHSKGRNDIKELVSVGGPWFQFEKDDDSFSIFENQQIMMEYLEPVAVDLHPQGMKCDFIFSNWTLQPTEYLTIDPETSTYQASPVLSGFMRRMDIGYPPTTEATYLSNLYTVGQLKVASYYYMYRGFVSIDTSEIPDAATIASAIFKATMSNDHSELDFDVKLYSGKNQWTGTGDLSWGDCATYEGVLSNTQGWTGEKSKSIFAESVNKTGTTQFRLISNREGTPPSSTYSEYIGLDSGKLTVTYAEVGGRVDIEPAADTFVSNAYPNTNYGSGLILYIDKGIPSPGIQVERTWLKFDLTVLTGWTVDDIDNATLCLWTQSQASYTNVLIMLMTSSDDSWTETGLTWSNQPSYSPQIYNVSLPYPSGVNIPYYWDATQIVKDTFSGDKIMTLMLNASEAGASTWHSREQGDYAPLIIINGPYSPSPSASAPGYIEVHAFLDGIETTADGFLVEYADSFETPYIREVKPGVYTVQVTYDSEMQEFIVAVEPSETEVVNAYFISEIPPGKAHIRVHAFLDGAEVSAAALIVETSQMFQTPAVVEVNPGTYTVKVTYGAVEKGYSVTVSEGETKIVNAHFAAEEEVEPDGVDEGTFDLDLRPLAIRFFGGTLETAGWTIALVSMLLTTFCGLLADRSGKHGFAIVFILYFEGLVWVIAGYIPWIVYLIFAFVGIWGIADKVKDWLGG